MMELQRNFMKQTYFEVDKNDFFLNIIFKPLTPNDPYSGRTAPLTSKRCILYIY